MTQAVGAVEAAGTVPRAGRVVGRRERLSWRQELVTVVLGTWLMVGLVVDGWAHSNLAELETFFTPWHGLFYSGFGATAAWIAWRVYAGQVAGRQGLAAVPIGYGLALVGAGVFAVGGAGDLVWHEVFGIEQDIEALFSPTHLLLFVGIVLILSAPLRAAWADDEPGSAPRYRAFLPVLLSVTLTALLVAFMFMFLGAWAFVDLSTGARAFAEAEGGPLWYHVQVAGLAGVFATNLVLLAPVLLLLRRWTPPFGTVTTLFTTVAVLTAAIAEFERAGLVPAAVVAGLAADVLIWRLRPSPARPVAYWAVGGIVPVLLWGAWFGALAVDQGVGLTLEMWSGAVAWAGLLGCALALLMLPPATPAGAHVAVAERRD